jgi:hypothetical protein
MQNHIWLRVVIERRKRGEKQKHDCMAAHATYFLLSQWGNPLDSTIGPVQT